jgi:hypothetical protein
MRFYGNAFGRPLVVREQVDEHGCDEFGRSIFGYFVVKVSEVFLELRDLFQRT